jgi:hypothetical protein
VPGENGREGRSAENGSVKRPFVAPTLSTAEKGLLSRLYAYALYGGGRCGEEGLVVLIDDGTEDGVLCVAWSIFGNAERHGGDPLRCATESRASRSTTQLRVRGSCGSARASERVTTFCEAREQAGRHRSGA